MARDGHDAGAPNTAAIDAALSPPADPTVLTCAARDNRQHAVVLRLRLDSSDAQGAPDDRIGQPHTRRSEFEQHGTRIRECSSAMSGDDHAERSGHSNTESQFAFSAAQIVVTTDAPGS